MTWGITVIADGSYHDVTVLLADDGTLADAIEEALEYMDKDYVGEVAILAGPQDEASQTFGKDQPENGEAS